MSEKIVNRVDPGDILRLLEVCKVSFEVLVDVGDILDFFEDCKAVIYDHDVITRKSNEIVVLRGNNVIFSKTRIYLHGETVIVIGLSFINKVNVSDAIGKRGTSKIIFVGCEFYEGMVFDDMDVEFINCVFDFSDEHYFDLIKFYNCSHVSVRDCVFKQFGKFETEPIFCYDSLLIVDNSNFNDCENILCLNRRFLKNVVFRNCGFKNTNFVVIDEIKSTESAFEEFEEDTSEEYEEDLFAKFEEGPFSKFEEYISEQFEEGTFAKLENCTFDNCNLTSLKTERRAFQDWSGEDHYEWYTTRVVETRSIPFNGME